MKQTLILTLFVSLWMSSPFCWAYVYSSPIAEDFEKQQIIDQLIQTENQSFGPNCWNTVLLVSQLTRSVRYTDDSEFWFWMNSPYCQSIAPSSPLQFGDIGSVHNIDGGLFHSFIRIDDDSLFQKGGPNVFQRWEKAPHESILLPINFNEAVLCKGNEATQRRNHCKYTTIYHRCSPVPRNLYTHYPELSSINNEVEIVERRIQQWLQRRTPNLQPVFHQDLLRLRDILSELDRMLFTGNKEFARKALAFRVGGLMFIDIDYFNVEPAPLQNARLEAENFFIRHRPRHTLQQMTDILYGPR